MKKSKPMSGPTTPEVRCAIYTRKSTEEGLEQEFNTLDAQREAGEAFIKSQLHEGWTLLPTRYDDGGFTGANMDRPALKRLMADIEAGKVDCVVVYKVDRLSRSLLDFARMMQLFESHSVAFTSVSQQFNSATSMGRLVLNVLLSFAQFEREIISERTRDKIAATRRKGKWAGGRPILGYDVHPETYKLLVNPTEAKQVRAIFALYLDHEALLPVVHELDRRGWANKQWSTRKGSRCGGDSFTKTSLYRLLTNVAYAGMVKYKAEVHAGEHEAIIDPGTWRRVQSLLVRNGRTGGAPVRNQFGFLLKGLLRCATCDCAMTPSHTTRHKSRRYRYYVCCNAQKKGWNACSSKSVPAGPIEQLVIDQIRGIGRDPALQAEVLAQLREQHHERRTALEAERHSLEHDLRRRHQERDDLTALLNRGTSTTALIGRLAELQHQIEAAEGRLRELRDQFHGLNSHALSDTDAAHALAAFEPVWATLTPQEQARLLDTLIQQVSFDGKNGKVSITFHPTGLSSLASDPAWASKEKCA